MLAIGILWFGRPAESRPPWWWRLAQSPTGTEVRLGLVAGRARIPTRLRSRIATSRLTAGPYRAVFEWIDGYTSEVVGRRGFDRLLPPLALQIIYEVVLGRAPDPIGRASFLPELESGNMSNRDFLQLLRGCNEGLAHPPYSARSLGSSLHESRIRFVRMLPRGSRILDLGGN